MPIKQWDLPAAENIEDTHKLSGAQSAAIGDDKSFSFGLIRTWIAGLINSNEKVNQKQDLKNEVISGGNITVDGTTINVSATGWRYEFEEYGDVDGQSFTDITPCSSNNFRYIGIYGTILDTIIKVEGTESTGVITKPTQPADTVLIDYVLVSSLGVVGSVGADALLKSDISSIAENVSGTETKKYVSPFSLKGWFTNILSTIISFTNTTESTSTTTGAVKIAGGLGVEKKIVANAVRISGMTGSGQRFVVSDSNQDLSAPYGAISPLISDSATITLLTTETNWNAANVYVGTALSSVNEQTQFYKDAKYLYILYNFDLPVRISLNSILHLIGNSGTPSIAAGTGAGTSPTALSVSGNDLGGRISFTTGTTPVAAGTVVTITFNRPYGAAPYVQLTPANAAANALTSTGKVYVSSATTTTFVVTVGATALPASTAFQFYYQAVQ